MPPEEQVYQNELGPEPTRQDGMHTHIRTPPFFTGVWGCLYLHHTFSTS